MAGTHHCINICKAPRAVWVRVPGVRNAPRPLPGLRHESGYTRPRRQAVSYKPSLTPSRPEPRIQLSSRLKGGRRSSWTTRQTAKQMTGGRASAGSARRSRVHGAHGLYFQREGVVLGFSLPPRRRAHTVLEGCATWFPKIVLSGLKSQGGTTYPTSLCSPDVL